MFTELTLKNFKSWQHIDKMRLAPITVLFGPNSSGKTSILQWFLLLKQTLESSDRKQPLALGDANSLVDLGTFHDVVYQHDEQSELSWSLKMRLPETLRIHDPEISSSKNRPLFEDDSLQYDCCIDSKSRNGSLRVSRLSYHFDEQAFEYSVSGDDGKESYVIDSHGTRDFQFKRNQGRAWPLPMPVNCHGFPDQVGAYFQNSGFLKELQLELEKAMSRLYYLGPLREFPKRTYQFSGTTPGDMGRRGERVVEALLAARQSGQKIARGNRRPPLSVEEYVAHWLKELKLIDSFAVRSISPHSKLFEVRVKKSPEASEVAITDVGFGISQILPVITLCYFVPKDSVVILEQPEIHLHPRVQSALADVLIDAMRIRRIQLIVESHSEHFLRRLQRRVAEEKLKHDECALYFCEQRPGGNSKLTPLKVDMFGSIANWPSDFFGDDFGEMAAITEAVGKRKLKATAR